MARELSQTYMWDSFGRIKVCIRSGHSETEN